MHRVDCVRVLTLLRLTDRQFQNPFQVTARATAKAPGAHEWDRALDVIQTTTAPADLTQLKILELS